MRNIVIGAGGIGSWLVPKLVRLESNVIIVDGDTLEKKNLDRQLFDNGHIGMNKAKALSLKHGLWTEDESSFVPEYFSSGLQINEDQFSENDLLWCCADNHTCRREVLDTCDMYGAKCIIAANEYVDFEAYYYEPSMAHSPNDPRVIYPDMLTDRSGDPLGPPGCVEAARTNRQLVIANSMASEMAMWLYWFHFHERPKADMELRNFWPIHHRGHSGGLRTVKWGDRLEVVTA